MKNGRGKVGEYDSSSVIPEGGEAGDAGDLITSFADAHADRI